jgi:hypothetical protein
MNRTQVQEVVVTGQPGGGLLRPSWPVAVTLGMIALTRTVARIAEHAAHAQADDRMPLTIILAVSVVWIVVLAVRRHTPAVPTLVAAGLIQATVGVVVMFVATWLIDGAPGGPLVRPAALLLTLSGGALWGLVCGAVALALQNARRGIPGSAGKPAETREVT